MVKAVAAHFNQFISSVTDFTTCSKPLNAGPKLSRSFSVNGGGNPRRVYISGAGVSILPKSFPVRASPLVLVTSKRVLDIEFQGYGRVGGQKLNSIFKSASIEARYAAIGTRTPPKQDANRQEPKAGWREIGEISLLDY
jgi:hypothetical protein